MKAFKNFLSSSARGGFMSFLFLIGTSLILLRCVQEWDVEIEEHIQEDYVVFQEGAGDTLVLLVKDGTDNVRLPKEEAGVVGAFFPEYGVVGVHQIFSKDTLLTGIPDISRTHARRINNTSADILNRTIDHFKGEGKYVVVYGFGLASFISQIAISREGPKADSYLLLGGRVKLAEDFSKAYLEKREAFFSRDGTSAIYPPYVASRGRWGRVSILGEAYSRDYLSELADQDLGNVFYTHFLPDAVLGNLTREEMDFLHDRGATTLEISGSERAMLQDQAFFDSIREFIRR